MSPAVRHSGFLHGSNALHARMVEHPQFADQCRGRATGACCVDCNESSYRTLCPPAARHLMLTKEEEEHRRNNSPSRRPGLCMDEMCICGKHKCPPPISTLPFEGSSTYRDTYQMQNYNCYRENLDRSRDAARQLAERSEAHNLPFEGSSTYRDTFGAQNAQAAVETLRQAKLHSQADRLNAAKRMGLIGPDGLPRLDNNGNPMCILDDAGFPIATASGGPLYDSHGNPIPGTGIGEQRVVGTGPGGAVYAPARINPETRDFGTTYNQSYVKNPIVVCPASLLPRPPSTSWPIHHSFWDCPTRTWY